MSKTSEDWFDLLSRLRALEQRMLQGEIDDVVRRIEALEAATARSLVLT